MKPKTKFSLSIILPGHIDFGSLCSMTVGELTGILWPGRTKWGKVKGTYSYRCCGGEEAPTTARKDVLSRLPRHENGSFKFTGQRPNQ